MDMMDFQEKMDPTHRAYFCRMLKMKDLPEFFLRQYVRVKMLADRMDAHLSPGELAIIAVMAGFDPETGKFCVTEQPVEEKAETQDEIDKRLQVMADEHAVRPEPVGQPADKAVDESSGQPTEQGQVAGATGQAQEQPVESCKLWSPGMPVTVLQEEDLKQGKIAGIHPPGPDSEKAVQLTVEFDGGETVTVDEDEVEAV